jgi:hypothetical protein
MHANRLLTAHSAIALGLEEALIMNNEAQWWNWETRFMFKIEHLDEYGQPEQEPDYYLTLAEASAAMGKYLQPGTWRVLTELATGDEITARKANQSEEMDFMFHKRSWELTGPDWEIRHWLIGYDTCLGLA